MYSLVIHGRGSHMQPITLAMSSIWSLLQRDVFSPREERLLEMAFVWKSGKRRKVCILCIIVSACRPLNLTLVKLKKVERDQYKRYEAWSLWDLKLVDGKSGVQETQDFELQFDMTYRWTASSFAQKKMLLSCLWRLNTRYLSGSIRFMNISSDLEDPSYQQEGEQTSTEEVLEEAEEEDGAYQEVTPRESADMLKLMEDYAPLVANAEAFMERLAKDLQVLNETNLKSILSSEQQVALLIEVLDEALEEAAHIEEILHVYEELLQTVQEQMDHIQEGNSMLHLIDSNRQRLTDQLLFLMDKLDLSEYHCRILNNADLSSPTNLKESIAAVGALSSCMNVRLRPEYRRMHGIAEQLITFESLQQNFEKSFVSHITQKFEQQGAEQDFALTQQIERLAIRTHTPYHHALLPYTPLMAWLKNINVLIFNDLLKVYIHSISKLYKCQIKAFFEGAKILLVKPTEGQRLSLQGSLDTLTTSMSSLRRHYLRLTENEDNTVEGSDHKIVSSALDEVYRQVAPMCVAEQDFVTSFFIVADQERAAVLPMHEQSSAQGELSCSTSGESQYLESSPEQLVNQWLNDIFSALEPELRTFINACNKLNTLSCLQILVTLSKHTGRARRSPVFSSSFLLSVLRNILLLARHNFFKGICDLCKEMEDFKVPNRKIIGILPLVSRFQEFVTEAEHVVTGSEGRADLDKAYSRVLDTVFSSINALPFLDLQINANMVMMENYHCIYCFLSEKKIHSLEAKRKEAKQEYGENLDKYIIRYLGKPLQKLNCFFDGVKALVGQGVKLEEVSFQLAYSKQELRKRIRMYPGKAVKQALEKQYRKILRDLSPEENLLPVVWHAMEQDFLRQYNEFKDLIRRCYPGSEITMDFSVDDLLNYFSTITKANQ